MATRIKTSLPNTEFTVATGNYDTSRAEEIDRVIIHTVVGTAQSAIDKFGAYGSGVSAHYIVDLDGTLYHGLEETSTAYQAGDYAMNQRSIGIEHADNGDYNGVRPDTLYTESAKLVNDICNFYNIPIDRSHILKHSEVIPTGCPDALDIDRIVREALTLNTPPLDPISQCNADRDHHWNNETKLCQAANVVLTPENEDGCVNEAVNNINEFKNKSSQTITIPMPESFSSTTIAATTSTPPPPSDTLDLNQNIPSNQSNLIQKFTGIIDWFFKGRK